MLDLEKKMVKKYGMKEPVFKGLDPRSMFVKLDAYLKRERWNLRYHPYDYYQRIVTAAYARWDFPKTRVIFSVNISAIDTAAPNHISALPNTVVPCLSSISFPPSQNKKRETPSPRFPLNFAI